jgi:hypothetical protein
MSSKIVFAALSLAIVLGGASAAMAGGKKAPPVDPRAAYLSSSAKTERPNGRQNWCDIDPACNGWGQALQLSQAKKIKF